MWFLGQYALLLPGFFLVTLNVFIDRSEHKMASPNYAFEKRKKEIAKKEKQQLKQQEKQQQKRSARSDHNSNDVVISPNVDLKQRNS